MDIQKNNRQLFIWAVTSALAGFLFGFDTVVISGAEQKIQSIWSLSASMHGLVISMALWGTVFGSFFGGYPTERFGRKPTLLWIGILYFISSLGSAFATNAYLFMGFRFLGGIGIGVCTVAAPLYIAEISPPNMRGRLTGMFQFNIVFGILVAFLSNALFHGIGENDWRWMLGIMAVPSLIYTVMCFSLPESPRWLLTKGKNREEGMRVFRLMLPDASEEEFLSLVKEVEGASSEEKGQRQLFTRPLIRPILLAVLIAFFNQFSGINAILYFAPRIFEMAGLTSHAALLQSVGIGITNLIFTFVGLWLIDRLGRRTLLYIGSFGYIASLGICSWAFYTENTSYVPICVFAFIAAHAIGQGAVIWVFISEIFPNQTRASGQALGSFTHWIFAAAITLFFPVMAKVLHPSIIFGFFCFMMILQLIWVKWMMPETKGVSLEGMQHNLRMH